jgi:hypothetical protein
MHAEIEAEKSRYEALLAEKNDMEMEYEERIKNMEERHLLGTQQTEAQYQHKIMAEVERYQQLCEFLMHIRKLHTHRTHTRM